MGGKEWRLKLTILKWLLKGAAHLKSCVSQNNTESKLNYWLGNNSKRQFIDNDNDFFSWNFVFIGPSRRLNILSNRCFKSEKLQDWINISDTDEHFSDCEHYLQDWIANTLTWGHGLIYSETFRKLQTRTPNLSFSKIKFLLTCFKQRTIPFEWPFLCAVLILW